MAGSADAALAGACDAAIVQAVGTMDAEACLAEVLAGRPDLHRRLFASMPVAHLRKLVERKRAG